MIPIIFRAVTTASQPFEMLVTINNLLISISVPPSNVVIFYQLVVAHKFILMRRKDH
jgi:hypothetical protein